MPCEDVKARENKSGEQPREAGKCKNENAKWPYRNGKYEVSRTRGCHK